ncbi:MAG TPA: hypothetical protein VNN80_23330, partial [Polyangiaceae bacterium]|nr:hypothetical protein [Polyangiaceae bacterium]
MRSIGFQVVAWGIATLSCLVLGCDEAPPRTTIGGDRGSAGSAGSPSRPAPPDFVGNADAGSDTIGCTTATCAELGKNCGPVPDGCGGLLECGTCADGAACGIVSRNVCTAYSELCVPASQELACAGKSCGIEGDGCGGTVECGSCPKGEACGLFEAFQCAPLRGDSERCPARLESCAEAGSECGLIGNGCGGTIDCGGCGAGELCGIDAPNRCGAAPRCEPLEPAVACQGHCGFASNGCGADVGGGVVDCDALFPCPRGQTCGGGGVPDQCGAGGALCDPIDEDT